MLQYNVQTGILVLSPFMCDLRHTISESSTSAILTHHRDVSGYCPLTYMYLCMQNYAEPILVGIKVGRLLKSVKIWRLFVSKSFSHLICVHMNFSCIQVCEYSNMHGGTGTALHRISTLMRWNQREGRSHLTACVTHLPSCSIHMSALYTYIWPIVLLQAVYLLCRKGPFLTIYFFVETEVLVQLPLLAIL